MKVWKISPRQFFVLTVVFTLGSAILYTPGLLVSKAKQDGWIAGFIGLGIGLLLVVLYSKIAEKVKDEDFFHFNQKVFGFYVGNAINYLLISYLIIICMLILRSMGDFVATQIMPETPIQYIYMLFMSVVVMGARYGLETVSRAAEIFLPWIILLLFTTIVLLLPQVDTQNLEPVLENGLSPLLEGAFAFLGFPFLELIALVIIYPHVSNNKKARASFLLGVLYAGLALILITALSIVVLGVDFTTRHSFPTYILAKKINIADFIQRIEIFVAIIWFLTIYFKLTLLFTISTMGISQVLKLKEHKVITFPLAIIIIIFANVIGPNIILLNEFSATIWPFYALTIGLIYPLLLLMVYKFKQRKKKSELNA